MNLTENYLTENGYDYFGNAAEDTIVFFVRDEDAPLAKPALQHVSGNCKEHKSVTSAINDDNTKAS